MGRAITDKKVILHHTTTKSLTIMETNCFSGVPNTHRDIVATTNNGGNIHGCYKPYPNLDANSLFFEIWLNENKKNIQSSYTPMFNNHAKWYWIFCLLHISRHSCNPKVMTKA